MESNNSGTANQHTAFGNRLFVVGVGVINGDERNHATHVAGIIAGSGSGAPLRRRREAVTCELSRVYLNIKDLSGTGVEEC